MLQNGRSEKQRPTRETPSGTDGGPRTATMRCGGGAIQRADATESQRQREIGPQDISLALSSSAIAIGYASAVKLPRGNP